MPVPESYKGYASGLFLLLSEHITQTTHGSSFVESLNTARRLLAPRTAEVGETAIQSVFPTCSRVCFST